VAMDSNWFTLKGLAKSLNGMLLPVLVGEAVVFVRQEIDELTSTLSKMKIQF